MATHEYAKAVRRELLEELRAAGIADAHLMFDDARCWVTTATDKALVDPVVAAHDAAAIDAAAEQERTRFQQDVALLKAYQGIAAPTLAQTAAATKAQNRVLARVVNELREG